MSNNDKNIDIKELKKGIQMILKAFNEQKEQYLKIINSMKEKIVSLEDEIAKLKEENSLYQNKLYTLQKNIKCISKTICQIKDDEESIEKNHSDMDKSDKSEKSNSSELEQNLMIKLTKDKNKDFFKKYNLNKLEMKKTTKNHKKHEINNYLKDGNNNYYSRDDDIQIKKKEKSDQIFLDKEYNTLTNTKYKNKKDLKNKYNNNISNDNKYIENKNEKEIKENIYDINNNIIEDK